MLKDKLGHRVGGAGLPVVTRGSSIGRAEDCRRLASKFIILLKSLVRFRPTRDRFDSCALKRIWSPALGTGPLDQMADRCSDKA